MRYDLETRTKQFAIDLRQKVKTLKVLNYTMADINQVMRSSGSIGANIVEGKSASSRREFKKYYEIALKSANETKYWLKLLIDRNVTNDKDRLEYSQLLDEAFEISNMLAVGVRNLKKSK
jgi:four helix bundle protein